MSKFTVAMDFEKSTPGTHRFKEVYPDNDMPKIGTLYIKKTALTQPAKSIKVTVEVIK